MFALTVFAFLIFMFWILFLPKKYVRKMCSIYCSLFVNVNDFIFGFKRRIIGTENIAKHPVIYALKHQSTYETFWFGSVIQNSAWIMKKSLMYIPILGLYFWRSGMVPIDRSKGRDSVMKMIKESKKIYERDCVLSIFPEGTRRPLGSEPAYKQGVYILYSELNMPVVPVALNTGLYWNRGLWNGKKGRVTMEFLPEIKPGLSKEQFMKKLQQDIETASNRLAKKP